MSADELWVSAQQTPDHTCPVCRMVMNAVTSVADDPMKVIALPAPGDLSICVYCLTFSVFQDDGTMRCATTEECEQVPEWMKMRIALQRGTQRVF